MKLSKSDTTELWASVIHADLTSHARVHALLLNTPTPPKHVPMRLFLPSQPSGGHEQGAFRAVQGLVPVYKDGKRMVLGDALADLLPMLFGVNGVGVVLHGARVPFHAPLEELMREVAYPDGWLYFVVVLS